MFTAALFIIAKTWKQPKHPLTDEWIKKMWYICTMEYYSAINNNEIMPFAATWMDLEIIILTEINQKEKVPYDITYMWNLKYDTNEPITETKTDSQIKRTDLQLPLQLQGGGGVWERRNGSLGLAEANYYIQMD